MGNTPSQEGSHRGQHRIPHKLSKPRTSNGTSNAPSQAHGKAFSASMPGSAYNSTHDFSEGFRSTGAFATATAEDRDVPDIKALKNALLAPEIGRSPSAASTKRLSGLFRSKSSITNSEAKRMSGVSQEGNQLIRAKSSAQAGRGSPFRRVEVVPPTPSIAAYEPRSPARLQHNPIPMESRNVSRTTVAQPSEADPVEQAELMLTGAWPTPDTPDNMSRTDSDLSMYIPMRRRSAQQIPGVATRPELPTSRQVTPRSSFRRSHPPTPNDSRCNSLEVNIPRRLSMPAVSLDHSYAMPIHTPTGSDYRQLGDISFGSLRITNGAPVPSPANTLEQRSSWLSSNDAPIDSKRDLTRRNSSPVHMSYRERENQKQLFSLVTDTAPPMQVNPSLNSAQQESPLPSPVITVYEAPVHDLETTSKSTEHEDNLFDEADSPVDADISAPNLSDLVIKQLQPHEGLHRSDSGFASTTSSQGIRTPLSKVDSGYSSSQSLRSVQQNGKKPSEIEITPPLPEVRSFDFQLGEQGGASATIKKLPPPPPKEPSPNRVLVASGAKQSAQPDPRRKSMPSRPPGLTRLPLLSPIKTFDGKSPKSSGRHSRNSSADFSPSPISSSSTQDHEDSSPLPPKQSRFQRFIDQTGETRKRLIGRRNSRDLKLLAQPVPSSPTEPPASPRYGRLHSKSLSHIRSRASRDTLATILSVGSAELDVEEMKEPIVDVRIDEETASVRTVPPPAPTSVAPPLVVRAPKVPSPVAPVPSAKHGTMPTSPRQSQRRRSFQNIMPTRRMSTKTSRRRSRHEDDGTSDDDDIPEGILGEESRMTSLENIRHMTGNSAFDQAFIAMYGDRLPNRPSEEPHMEPPAHLVRRASSKRRQAPPPLRTRSSAPNFHHVTLQPLSPLLSPGMSEDLVRGPPPPVSMRMHSVKSMKKQARRSRRASISAKEMAYLPPHPNFSHGGHPRPPPMRSATDYANYPDSSRGGPHGSPRFDAPNFGGGRPPPPSRSMSSDPRDPRRQNYQPSAQPRQPMLNMPPPRTAPSTHQRPWMSPDAYHYANRPSRSSHGPPTPSNRPREGPPYRVLHSYNSPAYRNVPIWG